MEEEKGESPEKIKLLGENQTEKNLQNKMSRSKWKGPYLNLNFITTIKENQATSLKMSRNSEIMPSFVDQEFTVYNGKKNIKVKVTKEMIGHKFGEFSFTRAQFKFKKK